MKTVSKLISKEKGQFVKNLKSTRKSQTHYQSQTLEEAEGVQLWQLWPGSEDGQEM